MILTIDRCNRPNTNDHHPSLSQSRVRKTIKLDPDVRKVSLECAVVITKATELFAMHLAAQSARTASLRGSRAVRDVDVLHTIHSSDALAFLRMDFPKKAITTSSGATSATVGNYASKILFCPVILFPPHYNLISYV